MDHNNTSGFFNDTVDPRQRCVAIWTYNTPESEEQYISYSLDGDYTFTEYQKNPVLAANSTQFRDPKVFWYE
ncbi:levanase, partial [Eggerthella sinensis]|nr:levanase [Eggerthella sinensis]